MNYDEILRPFISEDVPDGEETEETEVPTEEETETKESATDDEEI